LRTILFALGGGVIALAAVLSGAGGAMAAGAFVVDPQCHSFRDPIACTCFLQNGGWIGARWGMRVVFGPPNPQLIDVINNCTVAGRAASQK
jgi:hypothetical protein